VVTETPYSRSRSASLLGLALQIVGTAAAFALSYKVQSTALAQLGWYLLGGLPLWFITLLVFRQNELAALEKLDLEELRREKEASGGGEAIFDQAGAPLRLLCFSRCGGCGCCGTMPIRGPM